MDTSKSSEQRDRITDTKLPRKGNTEAMPNTPGLIVLQWLTYAFWGWTILSLLWLAFIVIANFIVGDDMSSVIPYAIASTLVLLPLSFVLDAVYGRKETVKKTGVATVVMVIHAVIFALLGIGVLIGAVLVFIQMLIDPATDNRYQTTTLATLALSAVIYGLTFFRTLNPSHSARVSRWFKYVMAVVIGAFIVLAFVGPVAKSVTTRDDRVIAANIGDVSNAVNDYVSTKQKLPGSLSDVSLSGDAKTIVDKGFVRFKAEGMKKNEYGDEYRYQLCVTYKAAQGSSQSYARGTPDYSSYLYVSEHPAGEVCYKLSARVTTEDNQTTYGEESSNI